MAPIKRDKLSLKKSWITTLKQEEVLKIDGTDIVCLPCQKSYKWVQKSDVQQHVEGRMHLNQLSKFQKCPEKQILLSESLVIEGRSGFLKDLCKACVSANIPWYKLCNPSFRQFLEKYTKYSCPDQSTLRKNYLPKLYTEALQSIRKEVGNSPIWVAVDETTDCCGRFIANVLVGALRKDELSRPHIISSKLLEKTNNATIIQTVLDSFQLLWPGAKQEDIASKFVLFLTDGAKYMIKAGNNLKKVYPNLLHVTCIVHAINRVAEEVRSQFPEVDDFVNNMKKIFRKSPSHVKTYRTKFPDLQLPPQPIITRWGTWLDAVEFYAEHLDQMITIVRALKADSAAVVKAKKLIDIPTLRSDFSFLCANYTFLSKKMTDMQAQNVSLVNMFKNLDEIETKLLSVNTGVGPQIISKYKSVVGKNPDLDKLRIIQNVLKGVENEDVDEDIGQINLSPMIIAAMKSAPLTTVDTERSFSMHKLLLSDRRKSMKIENLEMLVVTQFELRDFALLRSDNDE